MNHDVTNINCKEVISFKWNILQVVITVIIFEPCFFYFIKSLKIQRWLTSLMEHQNGWEPHGIQWQEFIH